MGEDEHFIFPLFSSNNFQNRLISAPSATGSHTGISDGDAGGAEESGPTAEECWPVLLLKSEMNQISRVETGHSGYRNEMRYTFSLRLSYNILRQRTKHELPRTKNNLRTCACHVKQGASSVHQNPTWNNQRWFFNVLLCHRMFRFTQGLAFKVCHTILQNLTSLSSA